MDREHQNLVLRELHVQFGIFGKVSTAYFDGEQIFVCFESGVDRAVPETFLGHPVTIGSPTGGFVALGNGHKFRK